MHYEAVRLSQPERPQGRRDSIRRALIAALERLGCTLMAQIALLIRNGGPETIDDPVCRWIFSAAKQQLTAGQPAAREEGPIKCNKHE